MCFYAYISSPTALREIEAKQKETTFFVTREEQNEFVRQIFQHPYIYYLGSSAGCGCGFSQGSEDSKRLKEYIVESYHTAGEVEVYVGEAPSYASEALIEKTRRTKKTITYDQFLAKEELWGYSLGGLTRIEDTG